MSAEQIRKGFDLIQQGTAFNNPLSGPVNSVSGIVYGAQSSCSSALSGLSPEAEHALEIAGVDTSGWTSQISSVTAPLNQINGYGNTTISEITDRISITDSYNYANTGLGQLTSCVDYDKLFSVFGEGTGWIGELGEWVSSMNDKVSEFYNAVMNSAAVSEIVRIAKLVRDGISSVVAAAVEMTNKVTALIAEELAKMEEYAKYATDYALAAIFGDYLDRDCVANIVGDLASEEMKSAYEAL